MQRSKRSPWRQALPVTGITLIAFLLAMPRASKAGSPVSPAGHAAVASHPNIVVILTDDQRWDTLWSMPVVQSQLVAKGVTFTNAMVVNSLCCPSRSTILTGKYSHTTLVYSNGGPYGGYSSFHDDDNTIATWLHDAGYYTGLVGKYLNGYSSLTIPPGWDKWSALKMISEDGGYYYNYSLNVDGSWVDYGNAESDYSTDVFASRADSFIRNAPATQPLFLYFAPHAPHLPATPANKYSNSFGDIQPYRPPNYNEADVSDKPAWVQGLPLLTAQGQKTVDRQRRNEYRTLLSVDDAVNTIIQALSDTHRLYNTLIVFSSDNGMAWGEHRWTKKQAAYEESIRVPLVVRYDKGVKTPRTDGHLVANVDFAPSFAAAAGVLSPGAEGLSFVPLLTNPNATWRHDLLVEHLQTVGATEIPTYCAVRDDSLQPEGYLYVSYLDSGEEELYDLKGDFYELTNVAKDPGYATQLDYLRTEETQLCNPLPP